VWKDKKPVTGEQNDSDKMIYQKALNTAIRLLTRRDHSGYELTQKLKQRDFAVDIVDKTIAECRRLNYLNDDRTARGFVRELKRKGYGKKRIQLELKRKGLTGKTVARILAEKVSESDERVGAERILQKNKKKFERETDPLKRRDKVYRFLHARGFSGEVITGIINKYR